MNLIIKTRLVLNHTSYKMATSKIQPGDKPGILGLRRLKAPDGLNIIESIAAKDYSTFGMFLLNDEDGNKVDVIKKNNRGADAPAVVEAIIKAWLDKTDSDPTYKHFVECLKDAEMGALAQHMKKMMTEAPPAASQAASSSSAGAAAATVSSPAAVPDDELDSSQLVFVLEAISDLNDWRKLGMYLGLIKQPTLDQIALKNNDGKDIDGCKTDMLQAWFNWQDNVEKKGFGKPSWKRLIDAVRKVNKQIADGIVKSAPWA